MTPDWSTPEGLDEIRTALAAAIPGWQQPVAYAVGLSSASSSAEWEFGHINVPGAPGGLAAVILASVLGHDGSTRTIDLNTAQLAAAVESLEPAEACTSREHPNLAAWRVALADAESNPARSIVAVFVADLQDPVSSEADGAMRATFEGHAPVL